MPPTSRASKVALKVDDDLIGIQTKPGRDFGNAVGARRMIGASHHDLAAGLSNDALDLGRIGRDPDRAGTGLLGTISDMQHHRSAGDRCEGFGGQARRGVARRYYDDERTHELRRAISRSLDFFEGVELARVFLEHDRDTVADRKRQAFRLADKFGGALLVYERPLAQRTDENLEQAWIHGRQ